MANATTALDIRLVSESFVQREYSKFGCSTLPKVLATDQVTGWSGTTSYKLGSLDNSLLRGLTNGSNLLDWYPGQTPPASRDLASDDISFTCVHRSTLGMDRFLKRAQTTRQRFSDLENNIVPILMSQIWQACDFDLAAALIDTNKWSTAKYFTVGTNGAGLDTASDYGNQNPIANIQTNLDILRPYAGFAGLKLECYMDGAVGSVLSRHPDYSGGGVASGVAGALTRSAFAELFKSLHNLDAVHIIDTLGNTAALGQTSSKVSIFGQSKANAVLWFGLVDRRAATFDLRTEGSSDAPDGTLVLASARDPEVISEVSDGKESETFWGKASYQVFSPRGTGGTDIADNLGFFYEGQTGTAGTQVANGVYAN